MSNLKQRSSCFVPGCDSGYGATKKRNKELGMKGPSFFKAPKDPNKRSKWQKVIPRADKQLTTNDVVCQRHFISSYIQTTFETKLSDGSIAVLARERPKLTDDAVPSIFANLPTYLSNTKLKRKPPIEKQPRTKKQRIQSPIVSSSVGRS